MLPAAGDLLKQDFKIKKQPSKTYLLKDGRIRGHIEGLEAVRQNVYCILNTERFDHIIYSWNFGVELNQLYGKTAGVIQSKIKKRIKEALLQDDRILSVEAFSFIQKGKILSVTFIVSTETGALSIEKEVVLHV